ncbi:MAG: hypothetical protein COA47_08265 [Robiginitomaculum sp.]|nr:MAG: hypothetical protein COA47_08265 [Robiginitomaculum sp.]
MSQFEKKIRQSTFLIVDDQDFLCGVLADLLRGFGAYDSHTAKNGAEAIEMLATLNPDIIFTDLNMEPVNGFELTKWVRRHPDSRNPEVPIVMLTGESDLKTIYGARDCGVSELIIKPVIPKQVLARLHAILTAPRGFVRSDSYVGPDRRRKKDPKYKGELRRACDPMEIEETSKEAKLANEGIRTVVLSLVESVAEFDPKCKDSLHHLLENIARLKNLAVTSNNPSVAKAISSLESYITAMGLNGDLLPSLLRDHLECIAALSFPGAVSRDVSEEMLQNLRQSVTNNLQNLRQA